MSVKHHAKFEVRLVSTPSTGYVWHLKTCPSELKHLGTDFIPRDRSLIGSPGEQAFRFEACEPGSYTIELELKRAWEGTAMKSHSVGVTVS